MHENETSLGRLFRGTSTAEETEETVAHVVACRSCWRHAAVALTRARTEKAFAPLPVAAALAEIIESEEHHSVREMRARAGLAAIRQLAWAEQRKRLNSVAYMRTQLFFKAILKEVTKLTRTDPHEAGSLTSLAQEVAALLPRGYPDELKSELRGEALIHTANCRRLTADFRGSRAALQEAHQFLQAGRGTPRLEAFWLLNDAALLTDIGQFEQALEALSRSAALYAEDLDPLGLALTGVEAGSIYLATGQYGEACHHSEKVLGLPLLPRRLELLAQGISIEALLRKNRITEARIRLSEAEPLFAEFPDCAPHEAYLQAILLDATGFPRDAEKRFREAAQQFLDTERYKDAMLCYLTLFESLFRREAFEKAAGLCQEILADRELLAMRVEIQAAWEELLVLVTRRMAATSRVWRLRQFVLRCWNVTVTWSRFEAAGTLPEDAPEVAQLSTLEPIGNEQSTGYGAKGRPLTGLNYHQELESLERELFSAVVISCNYSVRGTAKALNMSRNTVAAKMKRFGLTRNRLQMDAGKG
jgi:tetratricopeptide (TPR) repeat protein